MHYVFLFLALAALVPAIWYAFHGETLRGEKAVAHVATEMLCWDIVKAVFSVWFFYWLMTA